MLFWHFLNCVRKKIIKFLENSLNSFYISLNFIDNLSIKLIGFFANSSLNSQLMAHLTNVSIFTPDQKHNSCVRSDSVFFAAQYYYYYYNEMEDEKSGAKLIGWIDDGSKEPFNSIDITFNLFSMSIESIFHFTKNHSHRWAISEWSTEHGSHWSDVLSLFSFLAFHIYWVDWNFNNSKCVISFGCFSTWFRQSHFDKSFAFNCYRYSFSIHDFQVATEMNIVLNIQCEKGFLSL